MASEKPSLEGLRIDRSEIGETGGRWRLWIALAGIAVLALAAWGWLARPRAVEVRAAAAEARAGGSAAAGAVLNASGYVTARRQATVSSKITGKVVDVLVEEGMEIREGQVLAHLDDATLRKQLALAESQLGIAAALARRDRGAAEAGEAQPGRGCGACASRGSRLRPTSTTADADVDALAARLDLARQDTLVSERQLALRRQDLDDTVIRAPFAGVAVSKDAQPGEMISPVSAGGGFTRTGICTIVDMKSLEIEVDVNESYINRVRPGQKAVATLDAYPGLADPGARDHAGAHRPTGRRRRCRCGSGSSSSIRASCPTWA